MSVSVLYICTGNVCRSPMAELMFLAWSDRASGVTVASAGMAALVGQPLDTGSASALGQLGIDPTRHRARQFEPVMAARADLVLTAEVAHRDTVMTEVPSAFRRTFTMKEFARLAPHLRPGDPAAVIAEAARIRHVDGPAPDGADDMPDPYRQGVGPARVVAGEIAETVRAAVAALGLTPQAIAVGEARRPSPRPRPRPRPVP